ncbi:S-locus-specific glycoprotein BS29-2-like [Gossypium hirsutum]|uniref:S-locus-specific glycoprotein BS29-2-like n=1 Tax=Gossypium hirsutum TaxID=3635 RepID=A0ABM2ZDF9_GOSHI|nr:S-locus-specific glycoprotein BS29-2-like [Gossypium hirsutum]
MEDSTTKKYLGIWYKRMPIKTTVWVANRESPFNGSSTILKLTKQGILILQIHNGSTIWRSDTSRPPRNPSATLLDSGNSVVKDENESNDPENFLFRPGPWNGIRFSGTHELKPNKFFTVSVVINEKEVYDTYVLHDSLVLLRMVLTHDGLWERQTWTDGTQSWLVFVSSNGPL